MIIPVRLFRRPNGDITEALEPGESGALLYGAGAELVDSLAMARGITAYLTNRAAAKAEAKMVSLIEVEDKAVDASETENKGIEFPESRRGPGRSRPSGG